MIPAIAKPCCFLLKSFNVFIHSAFFHPSCLLVSTALHPGTALQAFTCLSFMHMLSVQYSLHFPVNSSRKLASPFIIVLFSPKSNGFRIYQNPALPGITVHRSFNPYAKRTFYWCTNLFTRSKGLAAKGSIDILHKKCLES